MNFDAETRRAIESAAQKYRVRGDLLHAIVSVESDYNPWSVRFDPRDKPLHRVEHFADKTGINAQTEMIFQSMRWGLLGIPGFLARRYGYKDPLQTLCGVNRNLEAGTEILADFSKKMQLEVRCISAWFWGDVFTQEKLKNEAQVKKVLNKLKTARASKFEFEDSPSEQ